MRKRVWAIVAVVLLVAACGFVYWNALDAPFVFDKQVLGGTWTFGVNWSGSTKAFGITEPDHGSDATHMETTAVRDGDEWVINGEKIFVTTGIRADGVVMWATIDKSAGRAGIKSFLIEKGTPGFVLGHKEKKLGIRADDTATYVFTDCRIPRDNLLGGDESVSRKGSGGFRGAMKTFNMTRPLVGDDCSQQSVSKYANK